VSDRNETPEPAVYVASAYRRFSAALVRREEATP